MILNEKERVKINKVFQKNKTYEPILTVQNTGYGFGGLKIDPSLGSNYFKNTEVIGFYTDYSKHRDYFLEDKRVVLITPKVINVEEKSFDFDSTYDVPKGNKIEIDGQEYIIIDKKYQLNGDIDYYIEDKYIKCESYEDLHDSIAKEVKAYLESKWELEKETQRQEAKKEIKEKKSIWWYLGIR